MLSIVVPDFRAPLCKRAPLRVGVSDKGHHYAGLTNAHTHTTEDLFNLVMDII